MNRDKIGTQTCYVHQHTFMETLCTHELKSASFILKDADFNSSALAEHGWTEGHPVD